MKRWAAVLPGVSRGEPTGADELPGAAAVKLDSSPAGCSWKKRVPEENVAVAAVVKGETSLLLLLPPPPPPGSGGESWERTADL